MIRRDELHDIASNMQAAFDFVCGLLKKEYQDAVNKALSHYKPEA